MKKDKKYGSYIS